MALVVKDRVQETSTTTGTGTITLAGAVSGFQAFSAIGNANTTYYAIVGGAEWEVGLGTYTLSGTTLSRDTVLSSSTGSKVSFSAGTKNVFVTYPASDSVYQDANNDAYAPQFVSSNGISLENGTIAASYTFPTGYNAVQAGDITISSGITVTVPSSSRWVIV
jgi:hypothetical protein